MSHRTRTLTADRRTATVLLLATAGLLLVLCALAPGARAAAVANVAPASLAFSASAGTISAPQAVTVQNTGDAPLTVGTVAVEGANGGEFPITNGCAGVSATVAPAASCTINVSFAPTSQGARTATLRITDNAGEQTVALQGDGTPPQAGVPGGRIDFAAAAGTTSAPQVAGLLNTSGQPLTVIDISIVGTNFAIASNSCGTSVAPGAGCNVGVTFSPDAVKGFTAILRFTTSDPATPVVDVTLFGNGTAGPPGPGDNPSTPGPGTVTVIGDSDQDGVPNATDACPRVAGDRANGCPSALDADVRGRWRVNALLSQLLSLTVRAPVGSRIVVQCKGKQGVCGFTQREIKRTTKPLTSLTKYFKGRRIFPAGTSITVRVTRAPQLGTYERVVTRTQRRLPKVTDRCLSTKDAIRACP